MDEFFDENNVSSQTELTDDIAEQAKKEYSEMIENAEKINSEETEKEKSKKDSEETSPYSIFFDVVSILATSAVIVGLAFLFCFRTVGVSGSSMYPTLEDGDRIILSAFISEPKYGEIVVTCQPSYFDYTLKSKGSPIISGVTLRMLVRSMTTTRSSLRIFQASCP